MAPSPASTSDAAPALSRRERRKLGTRQAIADAGLALFLSRGFDAVTVAEIADSADVAVSTIFKHFETKEAIAFARDRAVEDELVAAVTSRPPGVSIAAALRDHFVATPALVGGTPEFLALVRATPALTEYSDRMWSRHARALAGVIEAETGLGAADVRLRAWTRFVVQVPSVVRDETDREAAVDAVFELLSAGRVPRELTA